MPRAPSLPTNLALAFLGAAVVVFSPALAAGVLLAGILIASAFSGLPAALAALIIVSPWGSLGNVIVGGRLLALGPDIALIFLAIATPVVYRVEVPSSRVDRTALGLSILLMSWGLVELANPRGIPFVRALEGYRAFYLPMLGLPVGYGLTSGNEKVRRTICTAAILSATVVALMGIRQVLSPAWFDQAIIDHSQSGRLPFQITGTNRLRAYSPLPGPFHFGFLMTIGLTTATALSVRLRSVPILGATAVLSLGLALNATRLNWLGCATALVVFAATTVDRKRLAHLVSSIVRAGIAGVFAVWLLWATPFLEPVRQIGGELLKDPTANSSFVYRVLGWEYQVLPAIKAGPWLGYGTGSAKDGVGLFTSHNVILKVILEGGAVGLAAYAALTAAAITALWARRDDDLSRIGIAMIAAVHAAGMFGPILDAYPASFLYWLIIGAAIAAPRPTSDLGDRQPIVM